MINISLENNSNLYEDFEEGLSFLKTIKEENYKYPDKITYFHLYSEIKNDKELMAVKSFFATQNLDKTKLILWSDYNIQNNHRIQPFKDLIDLRIYNPLELAKNTPLEENREQLLATDSKHYMSSGMLRFLALYKMGGVWFDMDMILLRNFLPILDQEFAYQWGGEKDFNNFGPCAALMNIQRESEHSKICIDELIKSPIIPNSVCRDHELLAKVYRRRKFTIFPSTFFNTEWLINKKYVGMGTEIEKGWFKPTEHSNKLFLEAFAWHWHNGGGTNNYEVQPLSKFDILTSLINDKLKQRGLV